MEKRRKVHAAAFKATVAVAALSEQKTVTQLAAAHGVHPTQIEQCKKQEGAEEVFGEDFDRLAPLEVQTLVTADLEGEVSNGRLQWIRSEHPVELTKMLQGLANKGFLDQVGQKRWCRYRLPDWAPPLAPGAPPLALEAPPLAPEAPPLAPGIAPETDPVLLEIAKPAREKKKLTPALTKRLLRRLCEGRFLTAEQMAQLLDRTKDKLRDNFLAAMVNEGELQLRYPDQPTHPEQAYRSNPDWRER